MLDRGTHTGSKAILCQGNGMLALSVTDQDFMNDPGDDLENAFTDW